MVIIMWNGKKKAVTFSYDDGVEQDRRLIALFNKYGMKATFNQNSGIQTRADTFTQGNIVVHRRYSTEPPITVAFYNCICYRSICNIVCIRHAYDDYVVVY